MPARKKQSKGRTKHVMETSNALDLERCVFAQDHPKSIAPSLKKSAEQSRRRKAEPFRSAMSMLNLDIKGAGRKLPKDRRATLETAKDELRALYGRPRQLADGEPAGHGKSLARATEENCGTEHRVAENGRLSARHRILATQTTIWT